MIFFIEMLKKIFLNGSTKSGFRLQDTLSGFAEKEGMKEKQ